MDFGCFKHVWVDDYNHYITISTLALNSTLPLFLDFIFTSIFNIIIAMEKQPKSILEQIMEISINDPEKYTDVDNLLPEIRKQISPFYSQAKILSLDTPNANNHVKNGDLVHFRGAIQTDYSDGMHESRTNFKLVDGRIVSMFPIFVDAQKIEKRLSPKTKPNSSHRVYTVMAIPGESKWVQLNTEDQENFGTLADEVAQMNIENAKPKKANGKKNLFLIRIYDQQNCDFKPNDIIEFYGIYYYFDEFEDDQNDLETHIDRSCSYLFLPNIHLIDQRILRRDQLIERPETSLQLPLEFTPKLLHNRLLEFSAALMGFAGSSNSFGICYFLAALVAKTYQWAEEHPIPVCSMPMAFLNIADSRPFIHSAKLLLPMVQVVPMCTQILEDERLFSWKNHDTGIMEHGRLQLVPGTLLILDFTHYTSTAKIKKDNFVRENIEALQRLINEQKLDIDFGPVVPKFQLPMDIPIVALCPGLNPYFLQFPTLVPLPKATPPANANDGDEKDGRANLEAEMDKISPELLQNLRWHLNVARRDLDKITLAKEEQEKIVETFTGIRERLGTAAPDHFRHLLSLTRIHTALGGHSEMKNELYRLLLQEDFKRLALLRELGLK